MPKQVRHDDPNHGSSPERNRSGSRAEPSVSKSVYQLFTRNNPLFTLGLRVLSAGHVNIWSKVSSSGRKPVRFRTA